MSTPGGGIFHRTDIRFATCAQTAAEKAPPMARAGALLPVVFLPSGVDLRSSGEWPWKSQYEFGSADHGSPVSHIRK
jgi:hypothetical protein